MYKKELNIGIIMNHYDSYIQSSVSPLYYACQDGKIDFIAELLKSPDIDVNQVYELGETVLYLACRLGKLDIVQLLLKQTGINVNKSNKHFNAYLNEDNGVTPLMGAINGYITDVRVNIVRALLEHPDIDVNKSNNDGDTPLGLAVKSYNIDIVRALLEHPDIDVNKSNNDGDTPLGLAVKSYNIDIVHMLLEKSDVSSFLENEQLFIDNLEADYDLSRISDIFKDIKICLGKTESSLTLANHKKSGVFRQHILIKL